MNYRLTMALLLLGPIFSSYLFAQDQVETLSSYQVRRSSTCFGHPKVSLNSMEDTCVGLVLSEESGLKRPRRILSLHSLPNGNQKFIITDMTGWVANRGTVWLYDNETKSLTKLLERMDQVHGLALGPDNLVYVGTRQEIIRFNFEAPEQTKEVVINDLPSQGNHPLTHFIFNDLGDLIVNVGAPSDQCLNDRKKAQYPCPESEGSKPEAVIRLYKRLLNGKYSGATILARGLRNSMAMAIEPTTGQLFQGENNMDFEEEDKPREEINLIQEGAHYGWPYCFENGVLNPKYKKNWLNRIPNINCQNYTSPVALLPAHSAPLDMMFYEGDMFKELHGKLLVSLHGYRESGHRIVSLDLDNSFLPVESSRTEIVNNWHQKSSNPKGSPVGMTVDGEGRIWVVEDKNKTVLVISKDKFHSDGSTTDDEVKVLKVSQADKDNYKQLYDSLFENSCSGCHGQFQEDAEASIKELYENGFFRPGYGSQSGLYQRLIGSENGRQMPLGGPAVDPTLANEVKSFIDGLKFEN